VRHERGQEGVLKGHIGSGPVFYLSPSAILRRLVEDYVRRPGPGHPAAQRLESLSERRVEVQTLIGGGRTNAEIAETLFLSQATVKSHVGRIFAKLGLRDRAQAVIVAYETGLIIPGAA
jgi:DNA-binding NarL/FixJ family response regulator